MNPFNFRALQTMIDLGRITDKCTDCPQVIPIAGDLTMDGLKRDVYRMAYKAAQSRGAKVELKNKFYITLILDYIHTRLIYGLGQLLEYIIACCIEDIRWAWQPRYSPF